ncbi:uncharacterized protein AC631_04086 [Debaryomyces fabryi]|uniref:B30.2/SPRY domain-containing protein n=1 Tax=Debaryomyces fabryi TaxID=58627 RepID=A0A0V1PV58_9ASCO|nr:uncharacterized protein AC631_04086 [Debaryomyces fabryi]KSA00169.1 hypothetical protein AC631_04086 [Debaryomyces fabryi]CUM54471.1 unnamed protein product [Debaryomyces fabryi]
METIDKAKVSDQPELGEPIETSVDASIEPQVKEETLYNEAQAPIPISTTAHQYSTRSKDKKDNDNNLKSQLKQKQHNVIIQPRLKPVPFKKLDLTKNDGKEPSKQLIKKINEDKFYQSDDHPFNKRGFKYKPCKPNPLFPSNLYSTTDLPPFIVRPSYFDRSQGIIFNSDLSSVSTLQGWRSVRSNIGVREGKHYIEFNIINANTSADKSHVRIGFARKEASLEAPVGFDGYGYGLRDLNGQKITLSRPMEFMKNCKEIGVAGFKSGDVIGMLIELPSLEEHKKAIDDFINQKLKEKGTQSYDSHPGKKKRKTKKNNEADNDDEKFTKYNNISRDQIPIKYKNALYYEQYEYTTTKKMDHLLNPVTVFGEKAILENAGNSREATNLQTIPNSKITVFKNGIEIGVMFENLYSFLPTYLEDAELNVSYNTRQLQNTGYKNTDDGSLGYYPMLSVFQNGVVGINPGPDFKFPIAGLDNDVRPMSERYNEIIIDEWYWDLIDEVEAEYLDSFDV